MHDLRLTGATVVDGGANADMAGRTLVDLAADAGEEPTDTVFRLLADERDRVQVVLRDG